jgi:AmmeMemoRadiSam system protein A
LDYQTSGEITGEYQHSVSYAALGYFPYHTFRLGPEDSAWLLAAARDTLAHYLATGQRKSIAPGRRTPALQRRAAAFVTLHANGGLRGCIGRRAADQPLADAVPDLTLAAALEDTRFDPVARGETGLDLEISVLSPMKRIEDVAAFRLHDHGALLEAGAHHGLLLPQVATERDWSAQQFFEALARKTGVSRDVYRDPAARISVFRAQILR